ncbi:MAG: endonuclease III [Enterococcus sp.]
MISQEKTLLALSRMQAMFPNAQGELEYQTPFQLLIAVILSAQATDVSVNKVTPALFAAFPDATSLSQASEAAISEKIKSIGLYRTKAKNIKRCAQQLLTEFNGEIPRTHQELMTLAGVGKKTANVVLGDAFNIPGIAVDTHVERIAKRLRICKLDANVTEVEKTLMRKIPQELWIDAHHTMILFGRYHCTARNPQCSACPLLDLCQEGKQRLKNK